METKKCNKCGEVKLFSEFYKHKKLKDGLSTQCKCCENKVKKEYCKKHHKEIKEYRKKNQEKHKIYKKECKALLKSWYIKDNLIKDGWRKEDITEEIIEAQRNIIKTKRLIKQGIV